MAHAPSFALRMGLRLRRLREDAGLSREVFATRLPNHTPGQIRRYEEGLDLPSLPVARQLATALGMELPAFVDLDDGLDGPSLHGLIQRLRHAPPEHLAFLHRVLFTLLQGLDDGAPFDPTTAPVQPAPLRLLAHT